MRRTFYIFTAALVAISGLGVAAAPAPPAAATPASAAAAFATARPERIADLLSSGKTLLGGQLVVGGLGSSVGAGATLIDWGRDAPVAWFGSQLEQRGPGASLAHIRIVNGSVNGSTLHDGAYRDWPVLRRAHPDIVVLAYGMNDGAPAQFEAGETYAGAMQDLRTLITGIRTSGAVPVILTTPSAHTTRMNWNQYIGPRTPQQSPVSIASPVRTVHLAGGLTAPESTRHAAINVGFRQAAAEMGVDLIDVEPCWLRAVADKGQDALFNPSEFVHPNLLGHRLSYHAAIDAWFASGGATALR